MQVVTSEQCCVGIIALTGRIDATTASSFETSCRELLDSGAKKVVVDLGGVEYISSAGLRVILTMVKASKAAAATLALIPISREVFWGPMAYAMMGGIVVGTVLTLLFLPALYVTWFRIPRDVEHN